MGFLLFENYRSVESKYTFLFNMLRLLVWVKIKSFVMCNTVSVSCLHYVHMNGECMYFQVNVVVFIHTSADIKMKN